MRTAIEDDGTELSEEDSSTHHMFSQMKIDDIKPSSSSLKPASQHHNISTYSPEVSASSSSTSSASSFSPLAAAAAIGSAAATSSQSPIQRRRAPLRRESFEMAQQDGSSRRRNRITSIGGVDGASSPTSTTTMSKPPVGLSSSSSSSISTSQLVADLRRDDDIKKLDEAIFASTNRIDDDDILDPTALDSDSTDTSLNILKRNYDIIRQKSAENNTNLSVPPPQRSIEPETGELDDSANTSFVSTRSMNNITNQQQQPKLNRSLPVVKPTTRIKIVKKQKAASTTKSTTTNPTTTRNWSWNRTTSSARRDRNDRNEDVNVVYNEQECKPGCRGETRAATSTTASLEYSN